MTVTGLSSDISAITAGDSYTCALTTGGGVKCWGCNTSGQLGDGTTITRTAPVDVVGLSNGIKAITTGGQQDIEYHTCALTTTGGVKCWGANGFGQLGDGTYTTRLTPVDVSGLSSGVLAIAAGGAHTCALTNGGGVKCWGGSGLIGDGSNTDDRLTPADVYGLTSGVVSLSAGLYHSCAITEGGGAKCWGLNDHGQVGNGSTTPIEQLVPVDVTNLSSGVVSIAPSKAYSTCALMTNDGVKCWGRNGYGELGDGTTTTPRLLPVDVSGLSSSVSALATGYGHTCALTTDGGVKCWGANWSGQLGDGTTTQQLTPVDVVGLAGNPPPDLGFRPNPDGYNFSNYGGINAADFTTEDMRAMFGDVAVCQTTGAACTVKPAANDWNTWVNGLMSGGHCDGFTTTSLRFYAGIDNPATYQTGARHAYDLQLSNIRRRIAYFWALQVPDPVATARAQAVQKTPTEVLNQLQAVIAGGVASDATTLIVYNAQRTSGHSVVPYAVEDRGGGVSWVKVYDNNHPNDANRHVVITTTTNSWSYDLSWITWSGDATTHSLGAIPISEYAKSPTCPWCTGASLAAPASVALGQVGYAGPGNLLITDAQGKRIGFNGSQFINEIPSAFESVIPGGLGTATQPIYYLPITSTYTMLLDGQAVAGQAAPTQAQATPASFAFFGPGYAISLADSTMNAAAHNLLRVAPDGKQLAYQPSGQTVATVTLALEGVTQSYEFNVGDVEIDASQTVTLTANTTNEKLILDNSNNGAATYELRIARVSATGEQTFVHSGVAITATDTQYINYGTWNGAGEITVQIDRDSDGTIDQTITLDNQLKRVYLPLIRR